MPLKPPLPEGSVLSVPDETTVSDVLSDSVSVPLLQAERQIAPARINAIDLRAFFICPSEK
jgi:hypothetical protein